MNIVKYKCVLRTNRKCDKIIHRRICRQTGAFSHLPLSHTDQAAPTVVLDDWSMCLWTLPTRTLLSPMCSGLSQCADFPRRRPRCRERRPLCGSARGTSHARSGSPPSRTLGRQTPRLWATGYGSVSHSQRLGCLRHTLRKCNFNWILTTDHSAFA